MTEESVNVQTGEIVPVQPIQDAEITLFRATDPVKVIEQASITAGVLAQVIEKQRLYSNIQGKKYVRVEGWTLLGSMLGVFPVCTWTRPTADGWEARVEARTRSGAIVGAAEAECSRTEKSWSNRDDYALRSMAQTRATSKAMRLPLGFIVTMAGFEATPSEEIPAEGFSDRREEPADQGFGICTKHKVPFFQKGKMRNPGHPNGTDASGKPVWCHPPDDEDEDDAPEPAPAPKRSPTPGGRLMQLMTTRFGDDKTARDAWLDRNAPGVRGNKDVTADTLTWLADRLEAEMRADAGIDGPAEPAA